MKVAICVGHNAKYQGAISESGVTEYIFNSAIANLLCYHFRDTDYKVKQFHRPPIKSYRKQIKALAKEVNKFNPDVAIELHFNAGNSKARGHEVLYLGSSEIGLKYAKKLDDIFNSLLPNKDRGVKPIYKGGRGYRFLSEIYSPTLIAEPFFAGNLGFINENFGNILNSYIKFIQTFK